MAEGIGASFSIDVTQLKAGLAQANRLIRESESEFKAAAAGMDDWQDSSDGVAAKIKALNNITSFQKEKVKALQSEYDRLIANGLDPASREAVQLRTQINNETAALNRNEAELQKQTKALEEMGDSSNDASESVDKVKDSSEKAGEGFTIMKGAIANLVSKGIETFIGACKNAISSIAGLAQETQEYREDIGKLKTAFEASGKSTKLATKTYKDFYAVLGEEDRSVEAVNHLAKLVDTEEEMAKWTDIAAGVWGTFGDSLPIEGLTEAANETSKTGKLTGVLTDALNWAGVKEDDFQKSLDKCTTEQERQSLITETLNDLYSEAADLYYKNNKSVIEARNATSDLTDAQAELGKAIEPINTEISTMKTEFFKGLVPVIKNDVIPQIKKFMEQMNKSGTVKKFTDGVSTLAKKVLPLLAKLLEFVSENLGSLVKITLTAVTVFKSLQAAMAITATIRACTTAVAGLTAGVGFATKAQTLWNAAMSANPIGAVLTAVGLLTAGIMLLVSSEEDATEASDVLSESHRDAVTASHEAAKAYKEQKDAATELADAELDNIDYTKKLWDELKTLADKNGIVNVGYEERAKFILNELNEALGTEYEMNGRFILQYDEIKKSIESVIEAKKAQILLESYEESYREAVKNVSAAEQERAVQAQGLATAQAEYTEAVKAAEEAQRKYDDAVKFGSQNELIIAGRAKATARETLDEKKAVLQEQTDAYNESNANLQQYYSDIESYEKGSSLILSGETEKAIGYLGNLGKGFKDTANTSKNATAEQVATLKQRVIDTEVNLKLLESDYKQKEKGMTDEQKKQAKLRIENARKQAEDAKEEYATVGGNMVEGMSKGAEEKTWTLTGAMKSAVDAAIKAAKKAAGIESPSKLFKREVGQFIGLGIAAGIDDSTSDVVKSAKRQVGALQSAYGDYVPGVNNNAQTGLASGSKSVIVNQTNNYSQAHSRYELYKSKQQTAAAVRLALGGANA